MKRMKLMVVVMGLTILALAAQAQWEPATRLTWNAGESWAPDIAAFGSDNFHVVWYDDTPGRYFP